jgi:hypothetical protein
MSSLAFTSRNCYLIYSSMPLWWSGSNPVSRGHYFTYSISDTWFSKMFVMIRCYARKHFRRDLLVLLSYSVWFWFQSGVRFVYTRSWKLRQYQKVKDYLLNIPSACANLWQKYKFSCDLDAYSIIHKLWLDWKQRGY